MWALGCIAFELLAGREIFGAQYSDEEVMSMLIGFVKLPWEENPDFFTDSLPVSARNFVADLLQRSPEARKPIRTVLHSPLFTGDATGNAGGPNTEALKTPHGIFSTHSQWA
jgi:serine/threonine protein kinase